MLDAFLPACLPFTTSESSWAFVDMYWSSQEWKWIYSDAPEVYMQKRSFHSLSCDVSHKVKPQLKIYLKVFVDERLPVRFHLPKLWPQSFDLVLHPHDILKVPLRPQVQNLNWLRHVLHLWKRMKQCSIDFPSTTRLKCPPCSAVQEPAMLSLPKEPINILTSNRIMCSPSMCKLKRAFYWDT